MEGIFLHKNFSYDRKRSRKYYYNPSGIVYYKQFLHGRLFEVCDTRLLRKHMHIRECLDKRKIRPKQFV
jgi:hypothetical protein